MFKFDLMFFMIGIMIGVCGVIIIPPEIIVVYKTPTPMNINEKYIDENGNCYKYDVKEVSCKKNSDFILK